MIRSATAWPLWGSEVPPEPTSWGETSGEQRKWSAAGVLNDSTGYCVASLGLGNTAGADILEGDVW